MYATFSESIGNPVQQIDDIKLFYIYKKSHITLYRKRTVRLARVTE